MWTIAFLGSFPNCRTSNKDKGEENRGRLNLQCQFPFTLRNKTYWACTFDYSHITGYKPWCSTKVDPLTDPPIGKNANGLASPSLSTKHLDNSFFVNEVLPVPGGPYKPNTAPFASPLIHCANILSNCVLASLWS